MGNEGRDKIKIVIVLGPTASGKSSLAVKLAKEFNGEVVSADSRQVYRGMDIGSGKITKDEMEGVAHHLIDVASPKRNFSVGRFKRLAEEAIEKIDKRGRLPIVCGGTAFYIKALDEGLIFPEVKPDWRLRGELEKSSTEELFRLLSKIDPRRAKEIEAKNPRRLIRAIEVVKKSGSPTPLIRKSSSFSSIKIGIKRDSEELKRLIKKRLLERIDEGMIEETLRLRESGISWQRLDSFGLEYRWTAKFLKGEISKEEMIDSLFIDIVRFSKKQLSWFEKDKDVVWIKRYREASSAIRSWL